MRRDEVWHNTEAITECNSPFVFHSSKSTGSLVHDSVKSYIVDETLGYCNEPVHTTYLYDISIRPDSGVARHTAVMMFCHCTKSDGPSSP
jgi:hypothetical protein